MEENIEGKLIAEVGVGANIVTVIVQVLVIVLGVNKPSRGILVPDWPSSRRGGFHRHMMYDNDSQIT